LHGSPTVGTLGQPAVLKVDAREALAQRVVELGLWQRDEGGGRGRADEAIVFHVVAQLVQGGKGRVATRWMGVVQGVFVVLNAMR
jgi:hypothetical protein